MPYDITRTELVWPGKYDDDGKRREVERVTLPFQVIERVNESRGTREATKARGLTLFDVWQGDTGETFDDGWRNKLIWGDNKLVMSSLLDQFAGKVDLIYIDPPFATGADFSFVTQIGDSDVELTKNQSLIEEAAYRDTWGSGLSSYIEMLHDRLQLCHFLLSEKGLMYVHCDWRVNSHLRLSLDEIFGRDRFVNEIVWHYRTFQGQAHAYFPRKHDTLLLYSRGEKFTHAELFDTPSDDTIDSQRWAGYFQDGRIYGSLMPTQDSRFRRYLDKWIRTHGREPGPDDVIFENRGQPVDSVWDLKGLDPKSGERLGYPTQKPETLLRRVVEASSEQGSLVADFFCGSGTTQAVAEKTGRRWIGCDLGRFAVHTTRKRLLDIPDCRPLEILNLGRYERKYWQVANFGEDLDDDGVISLYEYVAFILKLYGASPAAGMQHLHGKLGRAFVHVGAVDSPVTIDEIASCVEESVALKARELHILGWEWEMGLHDPMTAEAAAQGVQLVLRQIPREVMEQQAVDKGDIEFFELAYLDVAIKPTRRKYEVVASLKNFVIPNPELVPDEVREKIRKWSDYVDYWAVDWTFLRGHLPPGMGHVPHAAGSLARVGVGCPHLRPRGQVCGHGQGDRHLRQRHLKDHRRRGRLTWPSPASRSSPSSGSSLSWMTGTPPSDPRSTSTRRLGATTSKSSRVGGRRGCCLSTS
jgi:DNA modification methylase